MALEELLDDKSGIKRPQKRKNKKILEEDEEEEGDNTKFFSMVEFKEEIEQVKHSFIAPVSDKIENKLASVASEVKEEIPVNKNGKDKKSDEKIPRNKFSKKSELHPYIKRLIDTNEGFKLYPVNESGLTREQLPILRDPNVKINIWGILKDNIGKDLSKITMPVYLNEPISFIQKQAEMIEYHELLKEANRCDDKYLRLIYVSTALYMNLTNAPGRMKKPFNSLLGETFEMVIGDIKYISEQISHHPPICAFYCESDDFIYQGACYMKSKLSISGFEFFKFGSQEITLKRTKETFNVFKSPVASLHNYIIGKPYLWFSGIYEMIERETNNKLTLDFKPKGWTSKNDYEVEGFVKDSNDQVKYHVFGKWDSFLSVVESESKKETQIALKKENPKSYELQYNFPKFTINFSHLSHDLLANIAPTDSRLRTDQKVYENGNLELASSEKNRLEENQRKRRKEHENKGTHWQPLWFEFQMEGEEFSAKYKGGYFESREKRTWPSEILDLYND